MHAKKFKFAAFMKSLLSACDFGGVKTRSRGALIRTLLQNFSYFEKCTNFERADNYEKAKNSEKSRESQKSHEF